MKAATVTPVTNAEFESTIATLVTAFVADPFIRWMLPDANQYLHYFPKLLGFFAGAAFEHGRAYRTDDGLGAALWLPPGVNSDEESMGELMMQAVPAERQQSVFAMLEKVGTSHPDVPHWYLPAIGVEPIAQGRGYGGLLMAEGTAVCEREEVAAYLESTNPENITLYQRYGFEVIGEIQLNDSPVLTRMLRVP